MFDSGPRPLRVLVVDDDASGAHQVRRVLSAVPQIDVEWAPGHASGLSRAELGVYDACLVGERLHGGGGRAFAQAAAARGIAAPVIVLGDGDGRHGQAQEAGDGGIAARLPRKQLNADGLVRCLREAIARVRVTADTPATSDTDPAEPTAPVEPRGLMLEGWSAQDRLRLLERAVASSRNGIVIVDETHPERRVLSVNRAFETMLGYAAADVVGQPSATLFRGAHSHLPELDRLRRDLRDGRDGEVVLQLQRKDGSGFWAQLAMSPVPDDDGTVTHVIGVLSDITERRTYEIELAYLASRDPVTGLPLLVAQEDLIARARTDADARQRRVGFVALALDRFAHLVETLGPATGDAALRTVGERLRAVVGREASVARLTSDSFLAVFPDMPDDIGVLAHADRLRAAVEPRVPMHPYSVHLTCTIGIALYPDHGRDTQSLLHCAEMAIARGRARGPNTITTFRPEFAAELRDRFQLGARLSEAITHGELVLHFQPQVRAHDSRVTGFEALVRWQSPEHGLLLPGRFLRAAEDLGLIVPLGRWVLDAACRQLRAWTERGYDDFRIAVNVSALQLLQPGFADEIDAIAREHGVAPARLELELTEDTLVHNMEQALASMRQLKRRGFSLALDDFGTGYSSLTYLRHMPLDTLKIDRSFLAEEGAMHGDAAIVRAIVAMGHQLRLNVVAEGLETETQLAFLRRAGCDAFQGYYFGRPLPAHAAAGVLAAGYVRPRDMKGVA